MADVFISYAREDRERAARLAGALAAKGWSVWWDRTIVPGQAFDAAIERELEGARCVVVLWSAASIDSEWVKNEAGAGAERDVLVPAMIEDVKLPLEFRRRQSAGLVDWNGADDHAGFQSLCQGIAAAITGAHEPSLERASAPNKASPWRSRLLLLAGGAVLVAVFLTLDLTRSGPDPQTGVAGPADMAVGTYVGEVVSDAKSGSQSGISLSITKLNYLSVRISSAYYRIGALDVTLTRAGDDIVNAAGETSFRLDLKSEPPVLECAPRRELTFRGRKLKAP